MATAISTDEAVNACKLAGNAMVPGKAPIQSELKTEASLVGLAYLNHIYQFSFPVLALELSSENMQSHFFTTIHRRLFSPCGGITPLGADAVDGDGAFAFDL